MSRSGGLYIGELAPVDGAGRGSRFAATGQDTYRGLDGYYAGETLEVGRNAEGVATHLDLATFIFTRTPYDPAAPGPGSAAPNAAGNSPAHDLAPLGIPPLSSKNRSATIVS